MKNILKEPSIWLLIFLVGFPQVSETIYTPSLPELASSLSATGNQIQQTLSIYFLGFAIGVLIWGILSDRIGRRPSMLYGISIYTLGSIACLFSNTIEYLLLARLVQAIGAAAGSVVTQTVMRDCYDDVRRPQIFAKVSAILAFSPAIGPLLGSIIADQLGVNYVFVTLVLIGLIAFTCSYYGLNETKSIESKSTQPILSIAKRMFFDKSIWIYGSAIGIINGIIFSYYAEAPFIFVNHLEFSIIQYGGIGFFVALASFFGAIIGKYLVKRHHYLLVMQIGFLTILIACGIFILIAWLGTSTIEQAVGFITSIFLIMIGIGIALPSCLSNALLNYKDCLGISGALLGLFYYLQVGLITGCMSFLHNGSTFTLPTYILAMSVVLLLLTLGLKNKKH